MADNFDPEMMRKFVEALSDATRQVDEITIGQRKEKEEREKNIQAIRQFGKELYGASKQLGKAMVDASDGASKYAGGIETAGSAAYDLGKSFGALGAVAGGLVNVFAKLAGASLRQQDALLKTYRALSQFGDLDNNSFSKLLSDLQSTGFAINQNADQYINALKKIAPELSVFAGSVSEGRKQVVSTFKLTLGQTEKQLARFGYTTEEMFEKTGSMISQMAFTNGKSRLTSEQLNKQSVVYLETLAALSELTGQTRDALDEQRKAQMNDLRWQMYLQDVKEKLGADAVEQEKNQLLMIESVFGKDKAQGYISKVVNAGRTVDEFGARMDMVFGQTGFMKLREGIYDSGNQAVNFANILKDLSPNLKHQFKIMQATGALGNDINKELGRDIETYRGVMLGENMDPTKLQKIIDDKKLASANSDIDSYTERMQRERQLRIAYEKVLQDAAPNVQAALDKFVQMITAVAKRLAQLLKRIGGPDYTSAFRDAADAMEDMTDEHTKYKKTLKDIRKIEEEKAKLGGDEYEAGRAKNPEIARLREQLKEQAGKILDLEDERQRLGGEGSMNEEARNNLSKVAGRQGSGTKSSTTSSAAPSSSNIITGQGVLAGLKIKQGDVQAPGKDIDPRLYEIAQKVQAKVEGFSHFTSFNDRYHQDFSSRHNEGKAFDFKLGYTPDKQAGRAIVAMLQGFGLKARDEYNFPSSGAIGNGHIHAELKAQEGGFFNGPKTGYVVEKHGPEGTFNLRQMKALNNALTKTPISGGGSPTEQDTKFMAIMDRVSDHMETLAELQRQNNSIQEDLLKYAKA